MQRTHSPGPRRDWVTMTDDHTYERSPSMLSLRTKERRPRRFFLDRIIRRKGSIDSIDNGGSASPRALGSPAGRPMDHESSYFKLDTDLEHMNGILRVSSSPHERPSSDLSTHRHNKFSKTHLGKKRKDQVNPAGPSNGNGGHTNMQWPGRFEYGQSATDHTNAFFTSLKNGSMNNLQKLTRLQTTSGPQSHQNLIADRKYSENSNWTPPESWAVRRNQEEIEANLRQINASQKSTSKSSATHYVRVFKEDGTFSTIQCPLDASVSELLQILGKKFFLNSVSNEQIGFQRHGMIRILKKHEKPLILQKRMLELFGYTDEDRLSELGREDLSYLCRILFLTSEHSLSDSKQEEDFTPNKKYSHVELQRRNLQTIPINLYNHAAEIFSLNISWNLSLDVPLDFMQACTNIREIKFVGNECVSLPRNIMQATTLNYMDISSNRLVDLDCALLDQHEILVSLQAQNNCLPRLPDSFMLLRSIRRLNLSFNYLTEFPPTVCNLVTLLDLDVSFNAIRELPAEIGQLCALERMVITNNHLTGSLPATFENLTSLRELDIRFNKLKNLDVVMALPRLEVFFSSHNSLSHLEIMAKSQYAPRKLRVFHLNQNPVTRFNFAVPIASLTTLNLSNAKLSNFPEGFFEQVTNLEKLILDRNHFGSIPPQIGKLRKLVKLSCVDNSLSTIPPEIKCLTDLRELDVHNNNLGSLPSEIWQLSNLESLNLSSNKLEAFPRLILNSMNSEGALRSKSSSDDLVTLKDIAATLRDSPSVSSKENSRKDITRLEDRPLTPRSTRSGTNGSGFQKVTLEPLIPDGPTGRKDSATSSRLANTMAQSLLYLYIADNSLNDECLQMISLLIELRVLNLSYNYLSEVPSGSLKRLTQLRELYLSGNDLTNLPADDLSYLTNLRVFHLNDNKLLNLPSELADIQHLTVLDVGSNSLKYNISNWPYDWNWNYNQELKYLNLSGNKRLEIKPSPSTGREANDLSDFSSLPHLRILGLMDVTLTNSSIPEQTEDRRVRTSGTEVHSMPYGMADTLGSRLHLSTTDIVVERFRNREDEVIFGMFDGEAFSDKGNCVAKFIQENFVYFLNEELEKQKGDENIPSALRRTFLSLNKEIGTCTMGDPDTRPRKVHPHRGSAVAKLGPEDANTGACAAVVYLKGNRIHIANVGDVRAILTRSDGEFRLLTTRHEPAFSPEIDRIREAGGFVSKTGKLNDTLTVSRSFGYFNMIPCVQAAPSIVEGELTDTDEMLIIASSELWEYMSYQTAVDIAATENDDPMLAAQKLRDFAIAYGASDKMVIMIVAVGDSARSKRKSHMQGFLKGKVASSEDEDIYPVLKRRWNRNALDDGSLRSGEGVPAPVGELAMVFTDIKNSTLLWETYPAAMRVAIKIHSAVMRRQLKVVGGYEVKTEGDSFMVCFQTATQALLFCFSVQTQLLAADWPTEILSTRDGAEVTDKDNNVLYRGLSVRIGVHWGSPVCELDPITRRMDYFGPMVNRAARISAVANGGEITASQDFVAEIARLNELFYKSLNNPSTMVDALGDESLAQAVIRDLKMLRDLEWGLKGIGEQKLKGLENPEVISLVYPKSLVGRLTIQQATAAARMQESELSPVSEILWSLRHVSLRLERICSILSGSEIGHTGDVELVAAMGQTEKNFSDNAVYPMVDHLVTRIENCISALYLRHITGAFSLEGSKELADLLSEVEKILRERKASSIIEQFSTQLDHEF
ncbi:uncharacterized protein V1510DRAFT_138580 [Dipodascopsis tothii]|uniref:uncharacterized protein n=1 Tax=Dipodascopsis tothii TaxID=44089 RepID=UPI0034CD98CC